MNFGIDTTPCGVTPLYQYIKVFFDFFYSLNVTSKWQQNDVRSTAFGCPREQGERF